MSLSTENQPRASLPHLAPLLFWVEFCSLPLSSSQGLLQTTLQTGRARSIIWRDRESLISTVGRRAGFQPSGDGAALAAGMRLYAWR